MNLCSLIGLSLKSDEVIEVLEDYELEVVYDFDRLHENTDDLYWASCRDAGFELRFNERQILDVIFMYVVPRDGFQPIDPAVTGVKLFGSSAAARAEFAEKVVPWVESKAADRWIKGTFQDHTIHYEFSDDHSLQRVTVALADEA
jgi:hypothetical protein